MGHLTLPNRAGFPTLAERPRATPSSKAPRAWQRMLSGRRLDLLDPSPFDIEIEDIAHAAHIKPGLEPKWRLAALLHDASEYVIGDMISPFKSALGVNYKAFEARLESAIHVRFGLPPKSPVAIKTLIKKADRACAFFEATQLAGFERAESLRLFGTPPAGYELTIDPLPAAVAQARYLERYRVLAEAVGILPAPDAWHTE